jgi:hypothetical protein
MANDWIGDLPDYDITNLADQRIVCAAMRKDDIVIVGARHYDKVMRATIELISAVDNQWAYSSLVVQGFIDQYGTFLDRSQAFIVAERQNQIRRLCGSESSQKLYSENLY